MRRLMGAVVLALVAMTQLTIPASAKTLRIVSVDVDARLAPDGRMRVAEAITYEFDGSFTSASRSIPSGPYEISGMEVRDEEGRLLPIAGEPNDLVWSFRAADQRRTFTVAYTVSNFLRVGSDIADLRWNWLGPGHPGVGELSANLTVPPTEGTDSVRGAWGHGPLKGRVEVEGNEIAWSAEKVPARTPLEGRVAVALEALTLEGGPTPILPAVVADEAAREAEAGRRRAAPREVSLDPERTAALNRWFAIVPVVGWMVFLLMWREWGREPQLRREVAHYVREPPDDPPALVVPLLEGGVIHARAAVATLIDLAQRGAIDIIEEAGGPERWIVRRQARPGGLLPFESHLLDRLFVEGDAVSGAQISEWTRRNPDAAARWWAGFCTQVQDELRQRQYIDQGPTVPFLINVTVGFLVLVLSINALTAGALVGAVGILSGVLQMGATLALGRRTPAGAQRLAEWRAFRRFLLDFSNLREAPLGHLELWERYLVYSVALGLSPDVAKGIAIKLPVDTEAAFASWFHTASPGGLHRFGVQVAAAGQLITPPPASSRPSVG